MDIADKSEIIRHFRRSLLSYDDHATVQRQTGEHLLEMLAKVSDVRTERVLEIGCGSGQLTRQFCGRYPVRQLYLNDIVSECVEQTGPKLSRENLTVLPLAGDIETICWPDRLNMILSSATLQWLADLSAFLHHCATSLCDNGILALSLFGPGTLAEVQSLTGVGLKYYQRTTISAFLEQYFHCLAEDECNWQQSFSSPRAVLRHIQRTGVGGVGGFTWTPRRLKQFEEEYRKRYTVGNMVQLSYTAYFFIARKKRIQP